MERPITSQQRFREAVADFHFNAELPYPEAVQKAVHVARRLQQRALQLQTPQERRQQRELDRMINSPHDRATLVQLTDQAFRSRAAHRAVDQLVHILDVQGIPRFFSPFDRTLLRGFQSFGSYLPGVAVPLVKEKMRQETANVILPAEKPLLVRHLSERYREGLRMNVNYLGEALLGEGQARQRLNAYLEALQIPEIEVISVKISTLYSQISSLARRATIETLCDRLELLYRAALKARFQRADGTVVPKFVYLDMEEYRDMEITAEAFMQTLDRPGLEQAQAGIALQAYLPDSFLVQQRINAWARRRVAAGGAPVTIRLVKGANMEMERVEASLLGLPQAPFREKIDTDANYKRMLHEALRPDNLAAVRLGVASHNLFDIAYAMVRVDEADAWSFVQFEMLEGMANAQRRAVFELVSNMLLYAPACRKEEFIYAIGYLLRRLDENTGPDNFLRYAFRLEVGSETWNRLENQFLQSFQRIAGLPHSPRRQQDRRFPEIDRDAGPDWQHFRNEPPTDFSLGPNVLWAEQIVQKWSAVHSDRAWMVPLVVAGQERYPDAETPNVCHDPSRPELVVCRYRTAEEQDVDRAVACAVEDPDGWRRRSVEERSAILAEVARQLRMARSDLVGAAMAGAGKTVLEADPEVSEAVDFVEFYRRSVEYYARQPRLSVRGKGVTVVISPWNFPLAIPCGGIAAALAAGNTVILKPASDAVLPAYILCTCFWKGGVPQTALQFLPCSGSGSARRLVRNPSVNSVILTGGTATAQAILADRPDCPLHAETGGKNATIVTAMSDRDQAIKHILVSAFSHSGQKCSATSLLLLEDEVYEDRTFRDALCDAAASLHVGSVWDLRTRVGPLIRPPRGDLEKGLKELEPGESWALMPEHRDGNPQLYSPGIKWGVQPGSFTHMTELFGPVLGVMKYRTLAEAISLVNATGYGLTSGLESLDDREHAEWLRGIRAGNLYINRPTTGAIVLRQPFGGMGKSAFGPGIKVGGPNYVVQFMHITETEPPRASSAALQLEDALLEEFLWQLRSRASRIGLSATDISRLVAAIYDYETAAKTEFRQKHDHFRLVGQDNFRLYLPVRELRIRWDPQDSWPDVFLRIAAARAAGCRPTISYPPDIPHEKLELLEQMTDSWAASIEFVEETDPQLAQAMREKHTQRVRYAHPEKVPHVIRIASAATGIYIADAPVLTVGRIELLWYVYEQSQSINYHRYGNLGERASETRAQPH
ncbi:MAG: proline dehydrogenase [Pirellulaceae bacterium]|nr:MAG: proline dehydrogenase [Pirellulaceae bacterium]